MAEPGNPPDAYAILAASPDLDGRAIGDANGRATIAIGFASWCGHCRVELGELAAIVERPDLRVVGVNFRWQEEYDGRGDSAAVRDFLAREAPWLRVAPGDERLYTALGSPLKVPTIFVYDRAGRLAAVYDRRRGPMPDARALADLLDRL
jgi:thiol-disulfide isomerase/thioredoxin